MKKIIPIFYACDDNFVKYTIISAKSLIENASKDYFYKIRVLNTNVSEEMKNKAYTLNCDNASVEFVNATSYLDSIKEKLPIRDYYSKTTYFRLFIAEMYPELDKAIYIDSDTIVLGDISKFYNTDLGDNYVGACNEQAMLQVNTYGDYVEQVVGIKRDKYFNAGHLLINCKQFRQVHILDSFIKLLGVYNFVVVQDEDYLNLLCKDHVKWIHNSWNTEVFGEVKWRDDEINVLHFIMWSKPWHFKDARYKEYFWKYAKKTCVYEETLDVLNNFTDDDRQKAFDGAANLERLAKAEIARPDNYLKLIESKKIVAA